MTSCSYGQQRRSRFSSSRRLFFYCFLFCQHQWSNRSLSRLLMILSLVFLGIVWAAIARLSVSGILRVSTSRILFYFILFHFFFIYFIYIYIFSASRFLFEATPTNIYFIYADLVLQMGCSTMRLGMRILASRQAFAIRCPPF